jgi:hypothetical protein
MAVGNHALLKKATIPRLFGAMHFPVTGLSEIGLDCNGVASETHAHPLSNFSKTLSDVAGVFNLLIV